MPNELRMTISHPLDIGEREERGREFLLCGSWNMYDQVSINVTGWK